MHVFIDPGKSVVKWNENQSNDNIQIYTYFFNIMLEYKNKEKVYQKKK